MPRKMGASNHWIPPRKYAVRGIDPREIPEEIFEVMAAKTAMWNELVEAHTSHYEEYKQFLDLDKRHATMRQELITLQALRDDTWAALKRARQLHRVKRGPEIDPHKIAYDVVVKAVKTKAAELNVERERIKGNIEYAAYRESAKEAWNAIKRDIYGRYADRLSTADNGDVLDRFERARQLVMKRPGSTLAPKEDHQDYVRLRDTKHHIDGIPWEKLISLQDQRAGTHNAFRFLVEPPTETPKTTQEKRVPAIFRVGTTLLHFSVVVHRPFPVGSIVKTVVLTGRRNPYGRWEWFIVFELNTRDIPARSDPTNGAEATGIDIGWRADGQALKVATIAYPSDEGYGTEAIYLPSDVARMDAYLVRLQQHIDASKDETKRQIIEISESSTWDSQATDDLKRWRSGLQKMGARGLTKGIRLAELAEMPRLHSLLLTWELRHRRLTRERYGLYQRRTRRLTHFYQQITCNIVQRSQLVAIESLPLDRMARAKVAGGGRQRAALSIFRHWLGHYGRQMYIDVTAVLARNTSQICAVCGAEVLEAYRNSEYQLCTNGHTFNRDDNASINIARRGSKVTGKSLAMLGEKIISNDLPLQVTIGAPVTQKPHRHRRSSETPQLSLMFE